MRVNEKKRGLKQCDQMSRSFDQYLAIHYNKNLPPSKKGCHCRLNILQNSKSTLKNCQRQLKLCQSRKTLANLVALDLEDESRERGEWKRRIFCERILHCLSWKVKLEEPIFSFVVERRSLIFHNIFGRPKFVSCKSESIAFPADPMSRLLLQSI